MSAFQNITQLGILYNNANIIHGHADDFRDNIPTLLLLVFIKMFLFQSKYSCQ